MFRCDGATAKSSVKKKNLNPIYRERFALPVDPSHVPTAQLSVEVFDYDLVGANDPIGAIVPIPVYTLTRKWGKRAWYPLMPPGADEADGADGSARRRRRRRRRGGARHVPARLVGAASGSRRHGDGPLLRIGRLGTGE